MYLRFHIYVFLVLQAMV